MNPPDRIDTDLLSAWLDDELPAADRTRVDDWLRDHPEDAARVRLWAADREALRARLGPIADEPLPAALEATVRRRAAAAPQRWLQAAAVVALLAAGAVLGASGLWAWQVGTGAQTLARSPQPWVERAALAHAVYVPEVRHPVEVDVLQGDAAAQRAQEEHLARWLTKRLDRPVKLFDLRAHGFELVGGRLLPDATGPSAQLMYQQPGGARVTVYLRRPDGDAAAAFRYEQKGRIGLFYWVEGRTGYALAGELPRERLLALAESIYDQLPPVPAPGASAAPPAPAAASR